MFQTEYGTRARIADFMYLVYGWMAFALCVTAGIAYYISTQPAVYETIFRTPGLFIILFLAQLGLVIALSAAINRISYSTAVALFMLYAASLGLTLSTIFFVYQLGSIYTTFAVTAGMFASMAIYGYVTKTDLTSMGNMLIMALFGLIIGSLVNLYFEHAGFDYLLSGLGVLIFTGLTAYDVQKIKQLAGFVDDESSNKIAVLCALTLYLDFVNLFLMLLRFMGKKK